MACVRKGSTEGTLEILAQYRFTERQSSIDERLAHFIRHRHDLVAVRRCCKCTGQALRLSTTTITLEALG